MNKQRKVLITTTYNEMGIIIDTKAEEVAQPNLQPTCNQLATDCISRQAAIDICTNAIDLWHGQLGEGALVAVQGRIKALPPVQPETAKRIVGKSRDGMTLWYQCDMCNEPVNAQDDFCRGCGRRLTDG